ncbi:MAG: ParB/RepB/Spo0J family partition protein [Acidobacteriaceae bacterium]|nr:ParB/RepB/Spo0J family partition protein [Acidobacteriaceae bacterium]MBV9499518.1 ParB/RepB/Spo0J family partition protein [Acidobacteriaceae bacterium]
MSKEPDRKPRKALGRGIHTLLPHRPPPADHALSVVPMPSPAEKPAVPEHFEEFQSIALDQIEPGEQQPRTHFDDAKLEELAQSIRANGVIQPITVIKSDTGKYRIVAGERRWRAAQLAGLKEIPALVRAVDPRHFLELALVENLQREDLNAIEIAEAFYTLATELQLSHDEIARRTGKDRSTVTNFIRLLRLAAPVKEMLLSGAISMGHARAVVNLLGDDQVHICQQITRNQLSVRQTEKLANDLVEQKAAGTWQEAKSASANPKPLDPNIRAALDEMAMALGTKVRLVPKSKAAGRLEIEYYSQDDLDRIYSVIVKQ